MAYHDMHARAYTCMHTFGSTLHKNHYTSSNILYTIIQALTVAWLTTTTYIPRASSPPVTWRAYNCKFKSNSQISRARTHTFTHVCTNIHTLHTFFFSISIATLSLLECNLTWRNFLGGWDGFNALAMRLEKDGSTTNKNNNVTH